MEGVDFFTQYFAYAKELNGSSEAPDIFHRWSAIVGLGAWLGNSFQLQHGRSLLNPNIYAMLIGEAGSRKSSSIKLLVGLMATAGYKYFGAKKTSREKYFMDLAEGMDNEHTVEDMMEKNLFGAANEHDASESFIAADEFNRFFQTNILEFVSDLGDLWDFTGSYPYRLKNSKSLIIHNPVISILGGNTQTALNAAFPSEIIGQGFFSRILMIYGEKTGHRITFPRAVSKEETTEMLELLQAIKLKCTGTVKVTPGAEKLLDKIYKNWKGIDDVRFDSYSNRRFTHLLKLTIIVAASRLQESITEHTVVAANTVLSYAEHFMPKALGEFGKAKHSDVAQKVIQIIEGTHLPLQPSAIFKQLSNDLDKPSDLAPILQNLVAAEKIKKTDIGFLLVRKQLEDRKDIVDFSILTKQEREKVGSDD